jgi:hypothetical protein
MVGALGTEFALVAPAGDTIYSSTGSFPSVSGVTSVYDSLRKDASYSLQLNTNPFTAPSSLCSNIQAGTGANLCQGWEQFVLSSNPTSSSVEIQYWLINAVPNGCPSGWTPAPLYGEQDCFTTYVGTVSPTLPITSLASVSVTASVASSGDTVSVSTGSGAAMVATGPDIFGLANTSGRWQTTEFNVFGYSSGSEASLNEGASLRIGIYAAYGPSAGDYTIAAPTCGGSSFTDETNNAVLGTCTPAEGAFWYNELRHTYSIARYPSLEFTESVAFLH